MAWYRRGKLATDVFRSFLSKITPKTPTTRHNTRVCQTGYLISATNKAKSCGFSSIFSRKFSLQSGESRSLTDSFHGGAKRVYSVDRYNKRPSQFKNNRNIFIVVMTCSGVLITLYLRSLETIPYSKRTHFFILSKDMERRIGDSLFNITKYMYRGKILPDTHPYSIRVRVIFEDMIQGLKRGLWEEKLQCDFEDFKWEVLVVDEPIENAFCMPGGKIVIYTGLLEDCETDAELAVIIGHEVAHALARHFVEGLANSLWLTILWSKPHQFVSRYTGKTMADLLILTSIVLITLHFSRRKEMEADYIGLLLMASAGYDPRVAPSVYLKISEDSLSIVEEYLSTHPSIEKRAYMLSQAHVMEEAVAIYREVAVNKKQFAKLDV